MSYPRSSGFFSPYARARTYGGGVAYLSSRIRKKRTARINGIRGLAA